MDGERYSDPVNDASVDGEIESLLAVEPSPEFVARVRAHVAQEPEPRGWRAPWMVAVPVVAAVVIVAMIAWPSRESSPSSGAPVQPPRVAEAVPPVETLPAASEPQRVRRDQPAARAIAVVAAPDRGIDIDLPEVVIADDEVKTFAALVASIRQSRFDVAVPAAPNPDPPLEIKELPPVEPLEIEPIVKLAARQSEGERP